MGSESGDWRGVEGDLEPQKVHKQLMEVAFSPSKTPFMLFAVPPERLGESAEGFVRIMYLLR